MTSNELERVRGQTYAWTHVRVGEVLSLWERAHVTIYSLSLWQPQAPSAVGSCQGGGASCALPVCCFGGGLSGEFLCSPTVRMVMEWYYTHCRPCASSLIPAFSVEYAWLLVYCWCVGTSSGVCVWCSYAGHQSWSGGAVWWLAEGVRGSGWTSVLVDAGALGAGWIVRVPWSLGVYSYTLRSSRGVHYTYGSVVRRRRRPGSECSGFQVARRHRHWSRHLQARQS